jgi:hypothetical protein
VAAIDLQRTGRDGSPRPLAVERPQSRLANTLTGTDQKSQFIVAFAECGQTSDFVFRPRR